MSTRANTKPKTPAQFAAELAEADMTVADWAREKKQPLGIVYQLLQGRVKGTRGNARKVARAMGLALPAITTTASAV